MNELDLLMRQWPLALAAAQTSGSTLPRGAGVGAATRGDAPLLPQRLDQLVWFGLSPATLERLRPYATVLPKATPVNLNTAPAPVLEAVLAGLDAASARQLVARRSQRPWNTLQEAADALGPLGRTLDHQQHAVSTQFFEIHGRIRIDDLVQEELALVQRDGQQVRMLWRRALAPQQRPTPLLQ